MEHKMIGLTLKVWRQKNSKDEGHFETYQVKDVSTEMSFLEMMDVLNEDLIREGKDPIEIGRAHVLTPVTATSRMPSSA